MTHTLEFPFTSVVFGRSFPVVVTIIFDYDEDELTYNLTPISLTGTDYDGNILDMGYLLEGEDELASFIIEMTYKCKHHWDKHEGDYWWGQERLIDQT